MSQCDWIAFDQDLLQVVSIVCVIVIAVFTVIYWYLSRRADQIDREETEAR